MIVYQPFQIILCLRLFSYINKCTLIYHSSIFCYCFISLFLLLHPLKHYDVGDFFLKHNFMLMGINFDSTIRLTKTLLKDFRGFNSFKVSIHINRSLERSSIKAHKLLFNICYIFIVDLRLFFLFGL
jgi:hypothetical protein